MTCDNLLSMSTEEVIAMRADVNKDLKRRAYEDLQLAVALYVQALGYKEGCENACDDLFRWIAPELYPGGWAGRLRHAIKAAG